MKAMNEQKAIEPSAKMKMAKEEAEDRGTTIC